VRSLPAGKLRENTGVEMPIVVHVFLIDKPYLKDFVSHPGLDEVEAGVDGFVGNIESHLHPTLYSHQQS